MVNLEQQPRELFLSRKPSDTHSNLPGGQVGRARAAGPRDLPASSIWTQYKYSPVISGTEMHQRLLWLRLQDQELFCQEQLFLFFTRRASRHLVCFSGGGVLFAKCEECLHIGRKIIRRRGNLVITV